MDYIIDLITVIIYTDIIDILILLQHHLRYFFIYLIINTKFDIYFCYSVVSVQFVQHFDYFHFPIYSNIIRIEVDFYPVFFIAHFVFHYLFSILIQFANIFNPNPTITFFQFSHILRITMIINITLIICLLFLLTLRFLFLFTLCFLFLLNNSLGLVWNMVCISDILSNHFILDLLFLLNNSLGLVDHIFMITCNLIKFFLHFYDLVFNINNTISTILLDIILFKFIILLMLPLNC